MNSNVTVLEIDLQAIKKNIFYFKSKLKKDTKIVAVVKAFAYGSDAVAVAKFIEKEKLAHYFAVAYTAEGLTLKNAGIQTPIIVLHPQISNLKQLFAAKLEPNIYSFALLDVFTKLVATKKETAYPIHIKINTGLNRLGFQISEIEKLTERLSKLKHLKVASIFSHLAASEDVNEKAFTLNQISIFKEASSKIIKKLNIEPLRHILNTSGIINYATKAQFDLVRLGIGMYGFANDKTETQKLQNVLKLKSVISQIHTVKKGETIGYNRAFTASKAIKIATVPIGHADGLSRKLGNKKGWVYINSKKAYIVGNVCMDMIMLDVTDIDCKTGDTVIIFESQEQLEQLALNAETISYEVLTALSQRIQRVNK